MRLYDDDYPTCVEAYATLRIYHAEASPDEVTEALGINPTRSQIKGKNIFHGKEVRRPLSAWFLGSKGKVHSRDVTRHIDWILDQIVDLGNVLASLRAKGWDADINCLWAGIGQGGPMLDAGQMARLAALHLSCGFEVFHERASEPVGAPQPATRRESEPHDRSNP